MDAAILGNIVADVIALPLDLQHPPQSGSLTQIESITLTTGGSVCNVSIAMAKLGMKVAGAGLVGDDALGRTLVERLREAGVNVDRVCSDARAQTSATIVAVAHGGERCFFHTASVTRLINAEVFRRSLELFRSCRWLHIAYFGLLPGLTDDLPELLKELRRSAPELKISMDTAHPPASRDKLDPILPFLDLFAPSRPEAAELTGQREPAEMVASFRQRMPHGVIGIKLDRDGCYLDDGASSFHVPAFRVNVIDTTGAGDAWFAGLICGMNRGFDLNDCGKLANRVAADCCAAIGASAGIRSFQDSMSGIA